MTYFTQMGASIDAAHLGHARPFAWDNVLLE
jgi:hypothetical protein